MAMEAALSKRMLDGREFEILLAVIFSMGILTGFLLSQAFCKSRGVYVPINGKERHSHRDVYLEEWRLLWAQWKY